VRTVRNEQKNLKTNLFFVGIFKATEEKSRIRIRKPVVRIRAGPDLKARYNEHNIWIGHLNVRQ